jgi:hypothetical protein
MCVRDNVHMHASLKRNHTCVSLLLDFPYFRKFFTTIGQWKDQQLLVSLLVLPVPLVTWINSLKHPLPSGTSPSRTHDYLTQHILHNWLHILWFMRLWFFWKSLVPQMKYIHQPQKLVMGMNFYSRLHGWEAYICSMGYQCQIIKSAQTIVFCEWKCNKYEEKFIHKCFH